MTIRCYPTEYTVTELDEDDVNRQVWSLTISWRGPGDSWAVKHLSSCLNNEGGWDWEPSPSNRDEEFRATHRFTFAEAAERAFAAYPKVVINGLRVEDGKLVPGMTAEEKADALRLKSEHEHRSQAMKNDDQAYFTPASAGSRGDRRGGRPRRGDDGPPSVRRWAVLPRRLQ